MLVRSNWPRLVFYFFVGLSQSRSSSPQSKGLRRSVEGYGWESWVDAERADSGEFVSRFDASRSRFPLRVGSLTRRSLSSLQLIKGFKDGKFNILVATQIGEEGLDIGAVDKIICYDAQKSSVRMVSSISTRHVALRSNLKWKS